MKRTRTTTEETVRGPPKRTFTRKNVNRNRPRLDRGNLILNKRSVGFPRTLTMRHRYFDTNVLTSTGGALTHYQFSCNGLYDPNITGTGHQPLYFDNCTGIYDHYTVIGSRIKVVAIGETPGESGTLTLWINDDTTTTATLFSIPEQSSSTTALVLPVDSGSKSTLTCNWSAKKTFGGNVLANDNLQGNASANPTEQSYYQLSYSTTDGVTTSSLVFQVFIEYIAVWDELKDLAAN